MMRSFLRRHTSSACATMLLLLCAILALNGCAGLSSSTMPPKTLWHLGDQYVAVAPKEQAPTAPPNVHPANLSPDRLQWALASLKLLPKDSDAPTPLFTDYELSVLSTNASNALGRASADEEVIFATIGNHASLYGLVKRPMVTTGRLFVAGGMLNLILGKIHEDVSDKDDRRLNPFIAGSRSGSQNTNSGRISSVIKGAELKSNRQDWILIPLTGMIDAPPPARGPVGSIDRSSESPKTVPAVNSSEKPAGSASMPRGKSPEERLRTLNSLREQGMITEDEYRSKRAQILNDL